MTHFQKENENLFTTEMDFLNAIYLIFCMMCVNGVGLTFVSHGIIGGSGAARARESRGALRPRSRHVPRRHSITARPRLTDVHHQHYDKE